jgi:uncharacterized membrane protein
VLDLISNYWGIGVVLIVLIFISYHVLISRHAALANIHNSYEKKVLNIGKKNFDLAKKDDNPINELLTSKRQEIELTKLKYFALLILLNFVASVLCVYLWKFNGLTFGDTPDVWGQMGDYFGGMLNPIFAFASFIALLYTIRIQSEELKLTRDELGKAAEAQKKSSEVLAIQATHLEKQNFENTFFKMLEKMHDLSKLTEVDESVVISVFDPRAKINSDGNLWGSHEAIPMEGNHRWFDATKKLAFNCPNFYRFADFCELMLQLVATGGPEHFRDEKDNLMLNLHKFYIDLILNAIHKDNLIMLIVWCAHSDSYIRLRGLVEYYQFFLKLGFEFDDEIGEGLPIALSGISKKAFTNK